MLGVLQALVGNQGPDAEPDPKAITSHTGVASCNERVNTGSTCDVSDEGALLLDQIPLSLDNTPFLVEVVPETEGIPLGIVISPDDDESYLTIDDVRRPGLIDLWNTYHSEEMIVRTGYKIMSVNGSADSAQDMLATIQNLGKGSPLRLLIQAQAGGTDDRELTGDSKISTISSIDGPPPRQLIDSGLPVEREDFIVELPLGRTNTPLGLAVSLEDDRHHVTIDGISTPGLIAEWNLSQDEALKVRVGDAITAVGSTSAVLCSGSGKQMLDMMTSIQHSNCGTKLHLRIVPRRPKRQVKREKRISQRSQGY